MDHLQSSSNKILLFQEILKQNLQPEDDKWNFKIPHFPNLQQSDKNNVQENGQKMLIMFITVKHNGLVLTVEKQAINRILSASVKRPEEIISISFANFRFPEELPKVTSDYIERLLDKGITLNSRKYIFYGHSNSQLKSRTCYLLCARDGDMVMNKINEFGDFSKFMSVAKRAKRIGLLFSAAEASVHLDKKFILDIDDIECDGHIFTDGCGMISSNFAHEISRKQKITFQNNQYCPSAFQIRYKGYKGMVMMNPGIDKDNKNVSVQSKGNNLTTENQRPPLKVQFRASMKKFKDCPDNSFSILDYSKPFTYACLNSELVTLLSCLGISDEIFKKKQDSYIKFLEMASTDPQTAFKYLCYKSEFKSAEDVLLNGITDSHKSKIKKLTREEWHGAYKKNDVKEGNERVRIMIPESRILFGVCDYSGTLVEGECHVRITTESGGHRSIDLGQVIVSRNPCLHPGDIRKFKPVYKDQLVHLVDCIVFPIVGKRDPASLMSGGDLDGDKFFVSWDVELIPEKLFEPYGYPPAKETPRREITYKNMIQYFAHYNNASLGRVKNLYLDWCRANPKEGAGSKECQQLNQLFSNCVDGERIKIPEYLQSPPLPSQDNEKTFIVDILCKNVMKTAETIFRHESESVGLTTREVFEALLSTSDIIRMPSLLNEYELYLMMLNWCEQNNDGRIDEFIHYFDFGAFTTPQKYSILSRLLIGRKCEVLKEQYIGQIFNALYQSDILSYEELRSSNLHNRAIRWQKLYSSFDDDGHRLSMNLEKAFENFDKKLLVFQVDENLKIAIYIPKRIEKFSEMDVGSLRDLVKLFAFQPDSGHGYKSNVRKGYKIFFDGEIFQLFELKRPNTFVWFALNEAYAARNSINSTSQFKVSIALQKFHKDLSKSHSRVIKQPSTGIEIYVISNRDRVGHQILENVMNDVETKEIMKILQNTPKDYSLEVDLIMNWKEKPVHCEQIIVQGKMDELWKLKSLEEFEVLFDCCLQIGDECINRLFDILHNILTNFKDFVQFPQLQEMILNLVTEIPSLSILITQTLHEGSEKPGHLFSLEQTKTSINFYYFSIASGLILSSNKFRETTLCQFKQLLKVMSTENIAHFLLTDIVKLVKFICFTIRDFQLAQDFLTVLFNEEERFNILNDLTFGIENKVEDSTSKLICIKYFSHFIKALAIEYLTGVHDNCPCDLWGLPIGAENQDESPGVKTPRNHLNIPANLAEFFKTKPINGNTSKPEKPAISSNTFVPEPHQKCLEITYCSDKPGVFETILRIDVQSIIRNEDHLRFCASKRSSNKNKQRITVFDAIALSINLGKLQFRILQKPIPIELTRASWNLYICASTTNMSTMCTAIHDLICLKEEATTAFHDILEIPYSSQKNVSKVEILLNNKKFNISQSTAVNEALNNPFTLIWGPPGTGKTTVIVEIIMNFLRIFPEFRILVTASTHNAVDNVMERFLKEREKLGNMSSEDTIRLTSDISKVSTNLKKWTLDAFVGANVITNDKAKGEAAKKLKQGNIIFSTCSGAGVGLLRSSRNDETSLWPIEDIDGKKSKKKKKSEEKFDIVIVDEASQITEPNAIIPITKTSKYVILVGDHVQLRPTVSAEMAKEFGLDTSLFEKLYVSKTIKVSKVMLNVQYRMHPDLSKFASDQFYESKLLSGVMASERILQTSKFPWSEIKSVDETITTIFPFVFINCPSNECYGSPSKSNKGQAEMTVQVVKMLRSSNDTNDKKPSIIILTPYTRQLVLIKNSLKDGGLAVTGVEVNTIDGFQGREADIIIFSTVRANKSQALGFLEDSRRMNVAVTRARLGLIVIGEENTLCENILWKALIKYSHKITLTKTK